MKNGKRAHGGQKSHCTRFRPAVQFRGGSNGIPHRTRTIPTQWDRGQATVEFLVVLVALLALLAFAVNAAGLKAKEVALAQQALEGKRAAIALAGAINAAGNAPNGFETVFFIAKPFDFNVSFHTGTVQVEWLSNVVDAPVTTRAVQFGTITPGGNVRVSKQGGIVVVGNA